MGWIETEKKHQQQWKDFHTLRQKSWDQLQKETNAMKEAFNGKEDQIPESVRQREKADYNKWNEQWGQEGTKAQELKAFQEQEKALLLEQEKNLIRQQLQKIKEKNREHNEERER